SLVSEKVISLVNVHTTNSNYFTIFDSFVQPLANIVFETANGNFEVGQTIFQYDMSNQVTASGVVLENTQDGANGEMFISVTSGEFANTELFYSSGNTIEANAITATDKTVTSRVMGIS